jgi:MFS family permease
MVHLYKPYRNEPAVTHPLAGPFRSLWIASTTGALADGITATALPLLIVSLTHDPVTVSLLHVATGLPWLLLGLHAGVLSDRWDRRRILWGADLFRLVLVVALILFVSAGTTSVAAILAVAFLYGGASVLFGSAAPAILPSVVGERDLSRANGRLQTGTTTTGSLVGPSMGGLMFTLAAWVPLLAQAGALAASVVALRRLPQSVPGPHDSKPRPPMRVEIAEGLRWIIRDRTLRALAIATTLLAASTGMLLAVLVLHVVDALHGAQSSYGLLFTLYAGGGLAASTVVPRAHALWGTRSCLIVSASLGTVSLLVVAWGTTVSYVAAGLVLLGVATMLYNVIAVTVRQQTTPDHLLGRVSSVFNVLGVGSLPPAAFAAGVLAKAYGTELSITVGASLCALATALIVVLIPRHETANSSQRDSERMQ